MRPAPAAALTEQLLDATRLHLISDVPVALFLSGGVDSAAIGALAQRAGADRLTALTIGFEDRALDESEPSRRSAELLGIPHRVLMLTARETHESLDHAMWAMDQPTVDGLNAYWICRTAARAGFKVALSGQGGDELFGGYASLALVRAIYARGGLAEACAERIRHRQFSITMRFPFRWRKLSYLAGADDPFRRGRISGENSFSAARCGRVARSGTRDGRRRWRIPRDAAKRQARTCANGLGALKEQICSKKSPISTFTRIWSLASCATATP